MEPKGVLLVGHAIFELVVFEQRHGRCAIRLQELEHAQAVGKLDIQAVWELSPVLEVVDVVDEARVVEVPILR